MKLQVWWIPQVPMKPFTVDIATLEEGVKILDTLADYDNFQFENNVKPDFSNAGGLNMWDDNFDGEGNSGWSSWFDDATGEDDPHQYIEDNS